VRECPSFNRTPKTESFILPKTIKSSKLLKWIRKSGGKVRRMGYRAYVKLVFKDGRIKEYRDVYIKYDTKMNGFRISKYSDFREEEFIPLEALNESECRKANPECAIITTVYLSDLCEKGMEKVAVYLLSLSGKEKLDILRESLSEKTMEKLEILREFRDNIMRKRKITNIMLSLYYKISPSIAKYLIENKHKSMVARLYFIDPCVELIQKMNLCGDRDRIKRFFYECCIYYIYISGLIYGWLLWKLSQWRGKLKCKSGVR